MGAYAPLLKVRGKCRFSTYACRCSIKANVRFPCVKLSLSSSYHFFKAILCELSSHLNAIKCFVIISSNSDSSMLFQDLQVKASPPVQAMPPIHNDPAIIQVIEGSYICLLL